MTKNVGLTQDSNQGPSRDEKKWEFLSKALPLSHEGRCKNSVILIKKINE